MKKLETELPSDILKVVARAAEINYEKNTDKLTGLTEKDLYMIGYIQGYQAAWSKYKDFDEEVLKAYDEDF